MQIWNFVNLNELKTVECLCSFFLVLSDLGKWLTGVMAMTMTLIMMIVMMILTVCIVMMIVIVKERKVMILIIIMMMMMKRLS